ncbi:MAG: hypothetical protein PHS82_03145 [Lachnospiraceae bacterium]|nr:hypothetical protein [Lachnospiraceae bacterium]
MSDKSFEQRIAEVVEEKLSSRIMEVIIEEKLKAGVEAAVADLFSYGGSGRKMIKEKMESILVPAIEKHDFNDYIVKLDDVLTDIVNNTNLKDNKTILENFKELMKEPISKEVKLSEIFQKYCEHVATSVNTSNLEVRCDDGDPYYSPVTATMEVEHEDKGWFSSSFQDCTVKFICEEDEDLNCQIKLYKRNTDLVWSFRSLENVADINSLRRISSFDIYMSTLNRVYADITIDTESEINDDIVPEEPPEWELS